MEADAHLEQVLLPRLLVVEAYRLLHHYGTGQGIDGAGEGHHQTIAQVLHLLAVASGDGFAQEAEVRLAQALGLVVTQLVEQLGRADEVGEEKGNGAARGLGHEIRHLGAMQGEYNAGGIALAIHALPKRPAVSEAPAPG